MLTGILLICSLASMQANNPACHVYHLGNDFTTQEQCTNAAITKRDTTEVRDKALERWGPSYENISVPRKMCGSAQYINTKLKQVTEL